VANRADQGGQHTAGAAALLAYITTGLFELGETHWHETAFRKLVSSLH
jgi:hypothetical protein